MSGRRGSLASLSSVVILGFAGCPLEEPAPARVPTTSSLPRNCQADAQCRSDQICLFKVCNDACARKVDCASGATCFDSGRGSACVRLQDNACIGDQDCPVRSHCQAGRCVTPCEAGSGSECFPGRTCVAGQCLVEVKALPSDAAGSSAPKTDLASIANIGPRAGSPAAGAAGLVGAPAAGGGDAGRPSAGVGGAAGVAGAAAIGGMQAAAGSPSPLDNIASVPPSCPEGSSQCRGASVIRCDTQGAETIEENCTYVCKDGACAGSCKPGSQRCFGNVRQTCDVRGAWFDMQTCDNVCTSLGCADECSAGSRQCDGNVAEVCRSGRFVQDRACSYVCAAGECSGECVPGERLCNNNAVASCDADGRWSAAVPCLNACVDGACTGVCTPGAQRCGGNSGIQLCGNSGRWGTTQPCSEQACVAGACTGVCSPGAARCDSSHALRTCQSDGQWGAASECAGQACVAGSCSGECSPAATRCEGAAVSVCGSDGTWGQERACVDQACVAGSCSGDCAPTSKRCKPDAPQLQVCDASGVWQGDMVCPGQSCSNAACVDATCKAGQSPDWYSATQSGGDPSLSDPRWGAAAPVAFALDGAGHSGGYIIVFDRAAGELAVTMRATLGDSEVPDPNDSVYFAIASNAGSGAAARAVRIVLIALNPGEGPQTLSALTGEAYQGSWAGSSADWLKQPAAWRAAAGSDISWAVSFRVDLARAEVDPAKAFRVTLSLNMNGAVDLLTPGDLAAVRDQPASWPELALDSACAAPARVQP